ncbi:MAG: cupin domain-containing protein [Acidobacteria bacterium]|nr:cupin domain-containing protein [Acidobacteriota bacterium]
MQKETQSRAGALLAIVAVGVFAMLVFGQPSTTAAVQSNFTGGEPSRPDSSDMRALRLRFGPGVRSNWHSHAGWQILAAEEGRGRTQERGGEIIEMVPGGSPVFAAAGVVHWHGAWPDEHVVQLTVLGGGDGGPTSWFGPVTDEEYRGE